MSGATVDATTPVLIGVGQVTHRDRSAATSAATLIAEAARRAINDTGAAGAVRSRLSTVGVTHCLSWAARNPAGVLAEAIGAGTGPAGTGPAGTGGTRPRKSVRTLVTQPGGTGPLDLLHHACSAIAAGDGGVTLLAGGEAIRAMIRGNAEDDGLSTSDMGPPDLVLGTERGPSHPAEERAGLFQPLHYYPLFEHAIRAAGGWTGLRAPAAQTTAAQTTAAQTTAEQTTAEQTTAKHAPAELGAVSLADHQKWLGDLWSRFAQVAGGNPYASLDGSPPGPDEIAVPGPGNRMVVHPYPKLLTANIHVDQAAAVLVCSAATAAAAGVPRDRWIFVAASAAAHDHWYVSERQYLHRSPAIAASGRAALAHAGLGIDDIAALDLYSCFPSAVQIAAAELGVDLSLRTPTVTGGLTFAGGPASSYTFHALAALTDRLRANTDDAAGLATAVGWFLTKHAVTVLTATPPRHHYRHANVQSDVDRRPRRQVVQGYRGKATVESWTVTYERDGSPSTAYATCLLPDGARAVVTTSVPETVAAIVRIDPIGGTAHLFEDGTFAI